MGAVIEFGMRQPANGKSRGSDLGQGNCRGIIYLGNIWSDWISSVAKRVALQTCFPPQKLLGIGGAESDPLRRSENPGQRQNRLTGQIPFRIAGFTQFGRVRSDVSTKFAQEEGVNDFWLVMRDALVESFIESKQVAGGASVSELHGSHQGATTLRIARSERRR